ncbi:hypothetical protein N7478_005569 [Penicillium angulare]|uniref:uncharacterized protein n=1 Tax=Penicillium angulare TaxID=116970 RepID=UPI00253F7CCE|nr:uncharacterized protein N7478_005569 [Penicillium angulare]KAJ5280197.1 hypothetical protein N7478_005569 [Penicillium angulare]
MPQISDTPESLLPRTDSRNPATTCRGITAQGRPCRRGLAPSQTPFPASTPRKRDDRSIVPDLSSLYCWQHKDQAASSTTGNGSNVAPKRRASIDTLMDRLGVLEIKDEKPVPNKATQKRRPRQKKTFCCFTIEEDSCEDYRPARPAQKPMQTRPSQGVSPSPQNPYQKVQRPVSTGRPQHGRVSSGPQMPLRPSAPNQRKSSSSSQTKSLLSWIPPTLSPQTTSVLLTELAKPISDADDEGYIYMFWVTPPTTTSRGNTTQTPLPSEIASSLIPPATSGNKSLRPPAQPRSVSDAISAARDMNALTSNPTSNTPGTIRLKIGRTSNVHRRMNEWTRQCSYDLTLIRYYPYTSSSASSSPARVPQPRAHAGLDANLVPGRKVPHVHRVERLIHLELTDIRLRDLGKCGECGKEHREWFEVEAAKEALKKVDECVRRWVSWGESMA